MKKLFLLLVCLLTIMSFASCDIITNILGKDNVPSNENEKTAFTVTFDTLCDVTIESQTISKGEKITEPGIPLRDGYTFIGWYVGDTEWSFTDSTITDDITLTAKWVPDRCNVFVYFTSETVKTYNLEYGSSIPALEDLEMDHYVFEGWYCNGKEWSFENDTITGETIITAIWTPVEYTITYDIGDGENHPDNPTTFTIEDLPLTLKSPTHPEKNFCGWFDGEGMTKKYATIDTCGNVSLYAAWGIRPWEKTTIIMEISENSNNSSSYSTARRYLAGDTSGVDETHAIDTLIATRNAMAYADANVTVEYRYLPDTYKYAWGKNIDRISNEVLSLSPGRADIYYNFIYDLLAASLKQSFASLLTSYTYDEEMDYIGPEHNYFDFEDNWYLEDNGSGYMLEYMRSLTLSRYKMYLLASDYSIDLIRESYVIPVNITLLESLEMSDEDGMYNSDRFDASTGQVGKDGRFTIEDFYQLVYDGEWTFDMLAAYSNAIYVNSVNGFDGSDLSDTLGFAIDVMSVSPAAALLYSSPISIIERTYNSNTDDYTYTYCATKLVNNSNFITDRHYELENLAEAIYTLFRSHGVVTVSNDEGFIATGKNIARVAISDRFANDKLLFGGIVTLSSLEYNDYKEMKEQGVGYGIAPVPIYRNEYTDASGITHRERYNTQIDNIGRVAAISYTTNKFAECSAFLNYQSTHSSDILEAYFDYKHQYDVGASEIKPNVEMLKFIRSNVGSGLDRNFDDMISIFYNTTDSYYSSPELIWHYVLKDNEYLISGEDMRAYYHSITPIKANRLYEIENTVIPSLPK